MEEIIFECLKDSQLAKEINKTIDVKTSAAFIINSWEGALVRAKVEKSNRPLEILEEIIFKRILVK